MRTAVACTATLAWMAGVGGIAPAHAEPPGQPLPPATSLGPPPVPCFGYGSSDNICPENGYDNPDPPEYMAATYYGTLEIDNHVVHVGDGVAMSANDDYGGEPSWSEGGPIISGCKNKVESGGVVVTPADSSCTWRAEAGSPYPPTEGSSGWRGGWEVFETDFCGFFGCAPSGDYYYVIGNGEAISGYVLDSAGQAATGAYVAIQGGETNVAAQVDPATGFYNALVPPGVYDVSVEREGPEAFTFGAGRVTSCSGTIAGPHCQVNANEHTGVASFELPLAVTGVHKNNGPVEGGSTVTIYGEGFSGASAVEFAPAEGASLPAKSFTVDSDSEITAVTPEAKAALPKGAKTLATDVRVTNNGAVSPLSRPGDEYVFGAIHTLTVDVVEGSASGKPVAGVKVAIAANSGNEKMEAATNEKGEVSEELQEASYNVTTNPAGAAVPLTGAENPDCLVQEGSCGVNLNQDRTVKFTTCVVPDPNGSPLPASTPTPIPGAITVGQLEAVGCWVPQNASGGGEATIFRSTQPVRLDGIDVKPLPGTTLQLDKSGPTVTSNGPAQVLVDTWPIVGGLVPPSNISLNYQGGSQLSVGDQGAGTGPLAPNLFGIPISLGTGGPAGYGLPFTESPGQTAISGGLQIPLNTDAIWNVEKGVFTEPNPAAVFTGGTFVQGNATVPSIGLGGSIIMTNRLGLTGKVCASVNDLGTDFLFPFPRDGFDDGEISSAQLCWSSAQSLWEGSGMFKLPTALSRLAGDIFVKLTAQKAKPAESAANQFLGYKLQNFGLQFEHINSQTYVAPGAAEVRSSGIPIGGGFFLQSLGGEFSNDLKTGQVSEIKGTMGISFGPEVNVGNGHGRGTELSILRGDLEFALLPSGPEISYWTYRLGGALTIGRLSPLELQLAAAKVTYHANPQNPEADFFGQLGGSVLGIGGGLTVAGQSDPTNGLLLEGTATAKAFGQVGTFDAIVNNYRLGVCLTVNGTPRIGFDKDLAEPSQPLTWGCNLGSFKHPTGATASAAGHVERLRLRRGLPATVLAVRGTSAAPRVRLSGPGRSILATPTLQARGEDGAIVFANPAKHTTYIGLVRPPAGRWSVSALPGSPAIAEVLQAEPGPVPKVSAHVTRAGCGDALRYRVRATGGDRILVYAQQGTGHVYVGRLHAGAGTLKLGLLARIKGRGKLVAYYLRAGQPQGSATLASFANAASNGSERPSGLKLRAGVLHWRQACDAAGYSVAIVHDKHTAKHTTAKPRLALPAGHGAATVTVTALTKGGVALGSIRRKLK